MSLSKRFFSMVIVFYFILSILMHLSINHITSSQFKALEAKEIKKSVQLFKNNISSLMDDQFRLLKDWAEWDDTKEFVLGTNPNYNNDMTSLETIINLNINTILIYDTKQQLILAKQVDLEKEMFYPLVPEEIDTLVRQYKLLSSKNNPVYVHDLVTYGRLPAIITASPILNNGGTGPVSGSMIFIRLLNTEGIDHLSQQIQMPVSYIKQEDIPETDHQLELHDALHNCDWTITHIESPSLVTIIAQLEGLNTASVHSFAIKMDRSIYKAGQSISKYLIINNIIFSILALIIFLWVTYIYVIKRIQKLYSDIKIIKTDDIESAAIETSGNDEIAKLGDEINSLLDAIRISQVDIYLKNKDLLKHQKDLEEQVKEKAAEIQRLSQNRESDLDR